MPINNDFFTDRLCLDVRKQGFEENKLGTSDKEFVLKAGCVRVSKKTNIEL